MVKTFKDAVEYALKETGVSLSAVAEATGVSYEQLKKLRQRPNASTNVDDAKRIANYFGKSLDEFLGDDLAQDRAAVVEAYNRLTPEERVLLRRLSSQG
jgi:transcriptional regulator with XRE-family HTH domain